MSLATYDAAIYICSFDDRGVYSRIMGRIDTLSGIILATYCYSSMKKWLHYYELNAHPIEECCACPIRYFCVGSCRAWPYYRKGKIDLVVGLCNF